MLYASTTFYCLCKIENKWIQIYGRKHQNSEKKWINVSVTYKTIANQKQKISLFNKGIVLGNSLWNCWKGEKVKFILGFSLDWWVILLILAIYWTFRSAFLKPQPAWPFIKLKSLPSYSWDNEIHDRKKNLKSWHKV